MTRFIIRSRIAESWEDKTAPFRSVAHRPTSVACLRDPVLQREPACPCGGGCPRCAAAELAIGPPGDRYEREADAVAERVMRRDDREAGAFPAGSRLQGAGGEGAEAGIPAAESAAAAPGVVEEVLKTPGEPLDPAARAFFEPRFGFDFGAVRVHTGARAGESAAALGASAYTVGSRVVFGEGSYAPSSPPGRGLLAHELSHVVQQSSGGRRIQRQAPGPAPAPGASTPFGGLRPSWTQPLFSLCPGEPDWSKIAPAFALHGLRLTDRDADGVRQNWRTSCLFLRRVGLGLDMAGELASLGLGFAYNDALSREAPTPVEQLERDDETVGVLSAQAAGREYHALPRSFFISPFPGFGEGDRFSVDLLLGGSPDPEYLQVVGGLGFSVRF